jgi:hypothetical protein
MASHDIFISSLPHGNFKVILWRICSLVADSFFDQLFGANMGEIIRFVPKSERERARLIREARAIYDSIFPPAAVSQQQDKGSLSQTASGANARRSNGVIRS